ncbi:MAG: prepilin-type N-terminal cleavage/methylation domain-containing protein [Planctomycetes bacterium]|nr:prepilin-type N-terminal cleavage/methylation domain-containing protein [Planctomycetota bacterium]
MKKTVWIAMVLLATLNPVWAGPYAGPLADPDNPYDAGVPGWIGPDGEGLADVPLLYPHPNNTVNPAFVGWATGAIGYMPAGEVATRYTHPELALGPATGDEFDVVSLGDLDADQIAQHLADPFDPDIAHPGQITLTFDRPIWNAAGADLAVFENGFVRLGSDSFFAELAYVEVSTDGINFARFHAISLTDQPAGGYYDQLTIDATDVYNLAGKHGNAHGMCWGTPFDLSDLGDDPMVADGTVNLFNINYIRMVDIPGSGDFLDSAEGEIYDAWPTVGSGGFDLDAVGILHTAPAGDVNFDGCVNIFDWAIFQPNFGTLTGMTWADGDFNADGDVDIFDWSLFQPNFGISAQSPPVPEPTTTALIAVGASAILWKTAKRRGRTEGLKRGHNSAFTLIELLVVVAIVALLASILLPSLSAAKHMAQKAVCASNIRQLTIANIGYATENDGAFVLAAEDMSYLNTKRWHGQRRPGESTFDSALSPLRDYLGADGAVRQCPSFFDYLKKGDIGAAAFEAGSGGYGYNATYIGARFDLYDYDSHAETDANRHSANISDILSPTETVMFTDTAYMDSAGLIEDSFCQPPYWLFAGKVTSRRPNPTIHFRHRLACNVAWADGHVDGQQMSFSASYQTHGRITAEQAREIGLGWFGPDSNELFDLQ